MFSLQFAAEACSAPCLSLHFIKPSQAASSEIEAEMVSSSIQPPAAGITPVELQPMRRPTANGAISPGNATQGSESTPSESQRNQPVQTNQANSLWSRKLFNVQLSLTRILSLLGLLLALIFGTGAWVGMEYANKYARGSYQIAMYELCLSDVSGLPLSFESANSLQLTPAFQETYRRACLQSDPLQGHGLTCCT